MKNKPNVIKTIFYDNEVEGRQVTESIVGDLRVLNVVESMPNVRLARGEPPREAVVGRPAKTKTIFFDDSIKERQEKTMELGGMQAVIVSEPTPMMRAEAGVKSDWADVVPAGTSVVSKVIHHDNSLRGRTVKHVMVDGMPTLVVAEPMPNVRR